MTTGGSNHADTYAGNADFWVRIIRDELDPYRSRLTDAAVLNAVGDCRGLEALDAGCGEGYMARKLADRGARVVGIDTSASLIRAAQEHPDATRLPVSFYTGSIESIPEPSERFDFSVCNHVMSDVTDPHAALKELGRVLKPGGKLVMMMLHPCFYVAHAERDASGNIPVSTYFQERHVDQTFLVAGIESPDEVHMTFRPLEYYTKAIIEAGFTIVGLEEPHPDVRDLEEDEWWRKNFAKPLFMLITAQRA